MADNESDPGGINISGGTTHAEDDIVGHDKIVNYYTIPGPEGAPARRGERLALVAFVFSALIAGLSVACLIAAVYVAYIRPQLAPSFSNTQLSTAESQRTAGAVQPFAGQSITCRAPGGCQVQIFDLQQTIVFNSALEQGDSIELGLPAGKFFYLVKSKNSAISSTPIANLESKGTITIAQGSSAHLDIAPNGQVALNYQSPVVAGSPPLPGIGLSEWYLNAIIAVSIIVLFVSITIFLRINKSMKQRRIKSITTDT